MAETQLLSERSDFDYRDLEECPRRTPAPKVRAVFITLGGIFFVLAFLVFMIRGSLPELTPEQIVQMKGYEGQQAPRHIFNLYGLRQYKEAKSLGAVNEFVATTPVKVISDNAPVVETVETVAVSSDLKPRISNRLPPLVPGEKKPATAAALKPTEKTVRTYEKAELKRQGSIPVLATLNTFAREIKRPEVKSPEVKASEVKAPEVKAPKIEVLPVLRVNADQARLRAEPSRDSDVLTLLSKGDTITLFNTVDQWTHVGINDGSSTTGYIHSSLLSEVKSK